MKVYYRTVSIVLLFALCIFFAFFHLLESPPPNFDEGWYVQMATNLIETGISGLQMAPGYIDGSSVFVSVGYPLIYSLGAWFKIIGPGILEGRILMALFLIGFVLVNYILSRRLFGAWTAVGVLLLLVTFPPLYGNGKAILAETPGLVFFSASLLMINLARTVTHRRTFFLVLAGVAVGLSVATKAAFILIIPALIVGAFIEWRRGTFSIKDLVIGGVSVLVPLVVWILAKFQPGDSLSTLLSFYANPSRVGDLSLTIIRNIKVLFTDTGPLYLTGLFTLWTISIILRLRSKTKIMVEEISAYIFTILTIISFTRTAGFYRYLYAAQLMTIVFFPQVLQVIAQTLKTKINVLGRPVIQWSFIALLSLMGLYQLGFNSYVADAYSSNKFHEITEYFESIPATTTIFFYNSTGLVPLFRGSDYYQYLVLFNQEDWLLGEEWLPVLKDGKVDLVVAGTVSERDKKALVFDRYEEIKTFDKVTILKRR